MFVNPDLVASIEFKEWTGPGRLRAPSFKGFTDDPWQEVTFEAEGPKYRDERVRRDRELVASTVSSLEKVDLKVLDSGTRIIAN